MIYKYNKRDNFLAPKILFLGIDWKYPRGGVASVEKVYSTIFLLFILYEL